jgi:predicted CXXCH cytochrome family protein
LTRKRPKSKTKGGLRKETVGPSRATQPQHIAANVSGGGHSSKRKIWIAVSAAAAIVAIGVASVFFAGGIINPLIRGSPAASTHEAAFVGSETCAGCHRAEAGLWRSSQHKHAMDHATENTVLGDFNDANFEYYGVRLRFFRRDGKFFVETDGPDGKLGVFEVKYTFGLDPLQQYLVEFPDGRLQALSIAWDSRPKDKGGQRWFHLYPDEEIRHDDFLHWTKLNQNWNFMCAECHSTGVRKNYDAAKDRFATTWAEISVGCEACHGRGSRHVGWAQARQSWWPFGQHDDRAKGLIVRFDERKDVTWPLDATSGNPQRSVTSAAVRKEVETCGFCHARRGAFSEGWVPGRSLSDTHHVSSISRGLYHADGQQRDEVYNYGSFKQSKMFAAGVTCSDCHDPHSAKLRYPGDDTCLQCHSTEKYANAKHAGHEAANPPLGCVSCHMPVRNYMVVDPRHDHSFRVPRPDLSAKLGTPNACNDCHADKPAAWAATAVERWHGPDRKKFQSFAEALDAGWTGKANAAALLAAVAADGGMPAIARASALTELASRLSPSNIDLARRGLADPDPMVRIAALDMLENAPAAQIWPFAAPLLSDPSRGVRMRAASLLAGVPTANQPAADRERFDRAAAEFVAAQRLNADRPEARSTLGSFYARRGQISDAEAEYKSALRLSGQYAPAAINLADLYRQLKRDGDAESVLRAAVASSPGDAGLHHALGLTLVRLGRRNDAVDELRKAAELAPDQARYAYVYAVGLHSGGRAGEAISVLKESLSRHPDDRDTLRALIGFNRDAGNAAAALDYAERFARISPHDRDLAGLIETLRRAANKPEGP